MAIEERIVPLAAEMAQLQASKRPTLTTLLGDERTVLFAVVRSALIALVGLSMMSVSGVLFRVARVADANARATPFQVDAARDLEEDLYQRVAEGVRSGAVKPNARAIQRAADDASAELAQRFLARLERDGVTRRTASGRAYEAIRPGAQPEGGARQAPSPRTTEPA
ncbi:hypothetical protein [uncultured Azohydromonas sp.]|jgi:hypothetical protein|uniref:hypothetical protein n=1 Tax=uncultured Azohydromonas sp. TaxID=487342 RepID=UPI00260354FD|nr:hypothetical protein [uncultured Azohydromonas sp.]